MYPVHLPYVDNAKAILITLAINLLAVFIFNWPGGVVYGEVLWDSVFCACLTTAIDMGVVYPRLKKMRAAGVMPRRVPESRLMQRLPAHPLALGILYAAVFAALALAANALLLSFFGIRALAFLPWTVYKLIYATVLSVMLVEYCIFRYVQPDWAGGKPEGGAAAVSADPGPPVKNPLPKIGMFKEIYGAVTGNIAMNFIMGTLLGGVVLGADASVVVFPTTVEGIPITGLVFGLIVGVLVTNGVVQAMRPIMAESGGAILAGAVPDRRLTWLPKSQAALTAVVCLAAMLFSAVALPAILTLFNLPVLNFYQFTVLISIYAALLGKPLSFILTKRCMQPDYVGYALGIPAPENSPAFRSVRHG